MPEITALSVPVDIPPDLQALLARPMLWPEEVERARRLARRYGVKLRFEKRDCDDWPAGWRPMEESQDAAD